MDVTILRKTRFIRLLAATAAASVATLTAGCGDKTAAQMSPPPPEVVVTSVSRGEVPIQLSYSGRTAGSREVEVRARVSGILLERLYEEGKRVREGEVLFRIDPEPFRAAAAQARAELAVAVAQRDEARRKRDRIVPLFEKSAVSQRERDAAVSAFEIGEANVAAAQARLRTAAARARLHRGARADRRAREPRGALRGQPRDGGRGLEPADAHRADRPAVRRVLDRRERGRAAAQRAHAATGRPPCASCSTTAASTRPPARSPSSTTPSTRLRARCARAPSCRTRAWRSLPGQFVSVRLSGVSLMAAVSLPRRAVMTSTKGSFVWVVGKGQVVELRPVRARPRVRRADASSPRG